ncbi:hypothetical protein ACJJTC_005935 [Scirpophaga incertulas]
MASNYYSKFSRSRNLVNLAIGSQNNSTQSEELGYENEEYVNIEPYFGPTIALAKTETGLCFLCTYLYAAKELNINIKHTFLEKGHTQNEGDSIHATIERAAKYKSIYTPSEWSSLIRWAKTKGTPYSVIDVTQNMIYDFKKMQTNACFNWTKNSEGEKIIWSKIKQIRVSRHEINVLFYKCDLSEDAVESHVKIVNPPVRTRRQMTDRSEIPLQVAYHQLLPIQPSKKKDLLDLCRKNIIPPLYHGYYESLVTSNDAILMNESDNEN